MDMARAAFMRRWSPGLAVALLLAACAAIGPNDG
jgi:hypothetical protein